MDEVKIIELFINYFGETGSLMLFVFVVSYGVFKYHVIRKQAELMSRMEDYLKVLSQKYSDTITYEQAEIILKNTYHNSHYHLIGNIETIIEKNNIEKEWKAISAKCKDIIDINYAEDFSKLTKFTYDSACLAEVMENSRRDRLFDGIIGILEKRSKDTAKSQCKSFIKNSMTKFYNEDIMKIGKRNKR